jgi:autotransporter-associated beta strand protein
LEDRTLLSASLLFDSAGNLSIFGDAGDSTIRQTFSSIGFLEVAVDGQSHSSDPTSALFDQTLAGACASTLAGIQFHAAAGHDTLTLAWDGFENRPIGNLAVSAAGADIIAQDLAVAGALTIKAQRISVDGPVRASAINLAGSGCVTVEAKGLLAADQIDVSAGVFVNSGQLNADGATGGQILISAGNVLNGGRISADGIGPGGTVRVAFSGSYVDTSAAVTSARGGIDEPEALATALAPGGTVTIDGGGAGHLFSSGRHDATGTIGGHVDLFGRDIELVAATVDASGETGGGTIRVGGDYHGGNVGQVSNLPSPSGQVGNLSHKAATVTVTGATIIRADALAAGDGGRVVVWSDQNTTFDGSVSARAGTPGGNGGFVEISGAATLNYGGTADTCAPAGKAGTLLLDPKNLIIDAVAGLLPQFNFVDPHPTPAGRFGDDLIVLNNGNVVVTNPSDNFGASNAGAVYVFNGLTGALVSSVVGSNPDDQVGVTTANGSVTALTNGNYVVPSPFWNGHRGAVTWGSGTTGVSGVISAANSLVGSSANDQVGYVTHLAGVLRLTNGNYVVLSPSWNGNVGAATWGSGAAGVSGVVSSANSLVGSLANDQVGFGADSLTNGNYVVRSPLWNGNRGAATWGSGTTGVSGAVSAANSLVGSSANDQVGYITDLAGVTALTNGNYVVMSPFWNGNRGAATWASGTAGVSGAVSPANSLVGSLPNDYVGGAVGLTNGNYVVVSPFWNGGLTYGRGAATWGSGTAGVSGVVSAANSLVGGLNSDHVGSRGVTALTNGNYVVESPDWGAAHQGAATWGSGTAGVSGVIGANSLVGTSANDHVGEAVLPLTNGNYVVRSFNWNSNRGAATWGSGTGGVSGGVSSANSLVGSSANDYVGLGADSLTNGNYVVASPHWNGNLGAATWGSGTAGVSGVVSAANSLVGSSANDQVGYARDRAGVQPLTNGNYVVPSPSWNGGRGAATWGSGTAGVSGAVSADNSLVGSLANDSVGNGGVIALTNGNYVVRSYNWNGGRGAATWGSGTAGVSGAVSAANSVVGSSPGDDVGVYDVALTSGNYVVQSYLWNGNRWAATWVSGTTGQTLDGSGIVSPQNSLVGLTANSGLAEPVADDPSHQAFIAAFPNEPGGRVTSGFVDANQLTFARGQSQTIAITPALLTRTLNTGGAVILQASNDITINSAITVSAGGSGGALTLQAGRSILINASITTDNGALTLIANDRLASGVVNAQRDPGPAVITMALGTALNTGTGVLTVELRDGAGLTNRASGAITLQIVTAAAVAVSNNGPSLGSDVILGPVASSGAQAYTSPNGTTFLMGNLSGSAVTFLGGVVTLTTPLTLAGTLTTQANLFYTNGQAVTVAGLATITGGTYVASSAPQTFNGGLALSGGTFLGQAGAVTVAGNFTQTGGTMYAPSANWSISGNFAINGGIFNADGGTVTFNGVLDQTLTSGGSFFANLVHSGGATLHLSGNNLFLSGTFTNSAGSLDANGLAVTVGGLTTIANGSQYLGGSGSQFFGGGLSMPAGGRLSGSNLFLGGDVSAGQDGSGNPATITGNLSLGGDSRTFTVAAGGDPVQLLISAVISDGPVVGLTKAGAGTLRLLADNTYPGTTAVVAGLLIVDGNQSGTNVVLSGGSLMGHGTVGGVTASGSTLSPGDPEATNILTSAGSVGLDSASIFSVRLNGTTAGTTYDQLNVAGAVNLDSDGGAGSTLAVSVGYAAQVGDTFTILTATGGITGTFAGLDEGATFSQGDFTFQITYQGGPNGNSVVLTRVS